MMKRIAYVVSFTLLLLFLPIMALASPSSIEYEGASVIWRVGETRVWRFPIEFDDEVIALTDAFDDLYSKGFRIEDVKAEKVNGKWRLAVGKYCLIEPKPEHAGLMRIPSHTLSLFMLSRMYEAVGELHAQELTPAYKLRGAYNVSGAVSWYGGERWFGRKFANGERFEEGHLTAAAMTLPFGTLVRISTPATGKSVVVRVTDRFREHKNRVLDISKAAAEILGIKSMGIAKVNVQVIGRVGKIGGK